MNYTEAVAYMDGIGKFSIGDPLQHAKGLLERVGNPQNDMKVIHVAGTNGKGSVCAYLASMLQEGGFSCGLFTSPHLVDLTERFKINGQMMDEETFARLFTKVKDVVDAFMAEGNEHPNYFEFLFVIGMLWFSEEKVEYAILETGLGGRIDTTNTVDKPLACIITSISKDHVEYLGDTIPEIAAEKAGIIKREVPIIFDGTVQEAADVIEKTAKEMNSPWYKLEPSMYQIISNTPDGITFSFNETDVLTIPYVASYQMMNASLAYFTMQKLRKVHGMSDEQLKKGIANTKWEGRMETILPGVIVDGAHNEDGVRRFIETAVHFKKDYKITVLFSAVADKQYQQMIADISRQIQPDTVVATQIEGYRIVPAGELGDEFLKNGCKEVIVEPDIAAAFEKAQSVKGDGLLFCVGSLYLVGEIKKCLRR